MWHVNNRDLSRHQQTWCLLRTCFVVHWWPSLQYSHVAEEGKEDLWSLFKILYIYLWLSWVFIAMSGLSLLASSGAYSLVVEYRCTTFHCRSFFCEAQVLGHAGFSSSNTWALLPWSMWNLSRPGIERVFPALAGGFPTTGLQGSLGISFIRALIPFLRAPLLWSSHALKSQFQTPSH